MLDSWFSLLYNCSHGKQTSASAHQGQAVIDLVRIYASEHATGSPESTRAVIVVVGQVIATLSIAQARDISNRLAVAADEAEAKLK